MPVCIAGMHRSGTSLVAKLLNQSGLYLGDPDDLVPSSLYNSDGHWEHRRFVELSDEIMNEVGAGWDVPPSTSVDWTRIVALPRLTQKAEALLAEFRGREPWGWKDPRATVTLPFWLHFWPDLQIITCVRNPLEVALSLRQRGLSSFTFGLHLWRLYNRRLEEHVPRDRQLVTHYAAV